MSDQSRVTELVEEALNSDRTPEEVCAGFPELLDEVRERWRRCRALESDIEAMFPSSSGSAGNPPVPPTDDTSLPEVPGYEVEAVLGRGGMGVVYRARHLRLKRLVALKMALAGTYAAPSERERFQREAEAVAALRHPNVVQIHDVGDAGGRPYYTMEYVDGGSLAQKLAGTPRPAREAAALLAPLAAAVHAAHEAGIVHRDLKPANVLLTADGVPKVGDFGLARRLGGEAALTRAGVAVGTPTYMAPEQARGDAGEVGPPADIYALGVILYELLTGRPPFQGASAAETLAQAAVQDPVPPSRLVPRVPIDLQTICLKCLEKDPAKRYPTAGSLAADLQRLMRGEPIEARPAGILERCRHWARRHKRVSAALAASALLLFAVVAGSLSAAVYFRELEGEQRSLAAKNDQLAKEREQARQEAVAAGTQQTILRRQAEEQGVELRRSLYLAQVNLAGQAAASPSGLGRVGERLAVWGHDLPDLRGWEWYYLHGLCHRDLATFRGHAGGVQDVAWSPDGRRLASAGTEGAVCLWDDAGRVTGFLRGHSHVAAAVAWSPDGRRLASASWDSTVKVWDATSGREQLTLRGHVGDVFTVAWSADGRRLASGGADRTVRVWDAADGNSLHVLRGHVEPVSGVAWSPDGRQLASAGRDATVRIWDTEAGVQERSLGGHVNWVNRVAWSPDGGRIASASNDQTVKIWDPAAGGELLTLSGHAQGVQSVAWNPDGTRLATGSDDQTIKVWPATGGPATLTLRGHTAPSTAVAWSPDGGRLASAGLDGAVKLWDPASAPEAVPLPGHEGPTQAVAWSGGADPLLASAGSDGAVIVLDVARRQVRATLRGHNGDVLAVSWSPDAERLASAGKDGTVRVWEAAAGREASVLRGHSGEVNSVSWSPDGRQLASAGADGAIRLWDAAGATEVRTCRGHRHAVYAVAWSPDGRQLASASGDQTVMVWDAAKGEEVLTVRGHAGEVVDVAWSPDGRRLASAGNDQTVRTWDVATGKPVQVFRGHTSRVNAVTWQPDGTRLASGGDDRSVKIWDVATGQEMLTLGAHAAQVSAVAWNADGSALASAGADPDILVHDATAGYAASRSPKHLPALDRRLVSDPRDQVARRVRAEAYAASGDWDRAAVDARALIALSPGERWLALSCWVAGPYPEDLSTSHAPEQHPDPNALVAREAGPPAHRVWQALPPESRGFLDFGALYGQAEHVSGYALFRVYSPGRQRVALLLGSDDQVRVWLNGTVVHEHLMPRKAEPDTDTVAATLEAGWNTLLIRVANEVKEHALYFRISEVSEDPARVSREPETAGSVR